MSDLRWKGFTASDFARDLEKETALTRRNSKVALRAGAKEILEASKTMAPVDTHSLEQAHHLDTVTLNKDNMELEISVGGFVNGVDVDDYAMLMHESQYNLGPDSQLKNASNPSNMPVGRKYLERAVEMHEEKLAALVAATLPGE